MARKTVSISITGTQDYVRAVKVVATKHGKTVSDIVRNALDSSIGTLIEAELTSPFFASDDARKPQSPERASHNIDRMLEVM
jgi:hypothetical protein